MNISRYNLKRFKPQNNPSIILPSGEYTAMLQYSTQKILKNKKDMLKLIWKIKDSDLTGQYFYSYFNMSDTGALNVFYKMIANMGFDPEKVKYIEELYGSECRLIVKQFDHPVHGKSNVVQRYFPVSTQIEVENESPQRAVSL
jgi:hypothetical protein